MSVAVLCCSGCGATVVGGDGGAAPSAEANGSVKVDEGSAPSGTQLTYMGYTDTVTLTDSYVATLKDDAAWTHADFIREVIADRRITADEMNEAERRSINCYAQYGLKVGVDYWFGDNGGGLVEKENDRYTQEQRADISTTCGLDTGYESIKEVYYQAVRNPDDVDLEPYRFQCYQEQGLLDAGYTYDEFERLVDNGTSPLSDYDSLDEASPTKRQLDQCVNDPLHHIAHSPLTGR
ncbi:hypothetical protein [Bifidobacterium simiiventris]|uniref:hypothetical protein n=1 Tax=Bifidobacterium simiiventris TaxID=2834434 RepID=UPI001C5A4FA5|nr:hypothetical protein [Bifidobacterium simiiventris]MBW3077793.1 hypothetical protein [Bifidobacterium simiiventris]